MFRLRGLPEADSFPSSNIAFFGPPTASGVDYFQTSDSGWRQVGYYHYDTIKGHVPYSNRYTPGTPWMAYPMSYNTKHTDSTFVYHSSLGVTKVYPTADTLVAIGYGTLKLPTVTYNNVLCVYTSVEHWFVVNGVHFPLLTLIQARDGNGNLLADLWNATYNAGTPLPLQISSFTVSWQNKMPYLQWEAANTENTKTFNVQRSVDGNTFNNVGQVAASNTSTAFHFTDNVTPTSTVYYRLQQVDKTGKFFYSNTLKLTINNYQLSIYPNPTKGSVRLSVPSGHQVAVMVYNVVGKLVYENKNFTSIDVINTSNWSNGTYTIRTKDNNVWQVSSFEKE